jgi:hypothetical protein
MSAARGLRKPILRGVAVGGGAVAAAALLSTLGARAQRVPAWRVLEPGLEHLSMERPDPEVDLVRFDLARFSPRVLVPGPRALTTADEVRRAENAVAAVNGGFFDPERRPLGLRIADGRTVVPFRARVDWGVLAVENQRARIVHSKDFVATDGLDSAIQVGPRLVAARKPLKLKPQTAFRTAVAVDQDGRRLTLAVTRSQAGAQDLANLLSRLGFEDAMMLDGGPSTQLALETPALSLRRPGGYPVPDLLVMRRR